MRGAVAGAGRVRSGARRFVGSSRTGLVRAFQRMRTGGSPASAALDKLEAVAGGIWSDAAEQFFVDGRVGVGELELSAAALP